MMLSRLDLVGLFIKWILDDILVSPVISVIQVRVYKMHSLETPHPNRPPLYLVNNARQSKINLSNRRCVCVVAVIMFGGCYRV